MENITISDFSGGVVENVSPTDFSPRQWAQLKGFVPDSDTIMRSQWPLQRMGTPYFSDDSNNNRNFQACQTLATGDGLFLIGIRENGDLKFCKVPGPEAAYTAGDSVIWYDVVEANLDEDDPTTSYKINKNIRFLTPMNFEAYKFVDDQDTNNGVTPAFLLGSRVRRNANNGADSDLNRVEQMVVVYYTGSSVAGSQLKMVCFPNSKRKLTTSNEDYNLPTSFDDNYDLENYPYLYVDKFNTLLPGQGIIPNCNVAANWNNALILGDIYWKRESSEKEPTLAENNPLTALADGQTFPYEGSIYFSVGRDVDKYDPRGVLDIASNGTELRGLHVLNDTIIAITSYGGENDGIVALRGNPGQLIRYDGGAANPFAVRRDLLRGGVGMPSRGRNNTNGHRGGSCVWPDAGIVVFIDKMGGVYYTNGETVGRLDEYGPCEPKAITNFDHVGATNKHLFVWRNERLWCLTLLGVDAGGENTACWTELVLPNDDDVDSPEDLRSLTGGREEMYFVWKGSVWRYATEGPDNERGLSHGQYIPLTISTRTVAVEGSTTDPLWHRFGMTFETSQGCYVDFVRIQSVGAKKRNIAQLIVDNKIGHKSWSLERTFLNENEGEFIVPAGVGAQSEVSATVVFYGEVILGSATFWVSGGRPNRGEVPG